MELLVDENGYNEFYKELDNLKEMLLSNAKDGSESYKSAVGDGWHDNFAFEESMRNENKIAKKINDMLNDSKNLKVIKETKIKDNIVKINDTIKLEIKYDDGDIEIETLKLTGNYNPKMDKEIMEITLNSPIGQAIYHKKILETCYYFVKGNKISLKILEIN